MTGNLRLARPAEGRGELTGDTIKNSQAAGVGAGADRDALIVATSLRLND